MQEILSQINLDSLLQIIMLTCTVIYSYLLLDCRKTAFLYGTIASLITGSVFFQSKVYIQGSLFIIYAISYMVSYFKWKDNIKEELPKNMTKKQLKISICFIFLFTIILGILLRNSENFIIDAITSALSILGVFWLNRKVIDHAYFFIISNIGSIFICYVNNDYMTIVTFLVYMLFNILRIFEWKKLKKRGEQN